MANWNENKVNAKIMLVSISSVCEPEQVIYGNIIKRKKKTNQTSENTDKQISLWEK